ncbi:MAG: lipopolysaccharide biosynthesis protein [Bacteroidales bacterium]|nr:lipopolysaccharide biosynthesis protein [Bacteroidales bacterium]MBD5257165.1 lipopolysaccharide biosynthesis protein [Barnesiella sp.]
MAEQSLKRQTLNGAIWRILESGGTQVIQFVISIVLARLILPEQFAAIAMLTIFIAIAEVFINSGFSTALMRKNNRTQTDCDTVYIFNIVVSVFSYIVLFIIAPFVAKFYNLPELCIILRVTSVSLVIGSFGGVHRTLFTARMDFKSLAKYNLLSLIVSGITGMTMAYLGFQVWALVTQSVLSTAIGTICICIGSKWRPTWTFSWSSLKEFFSFGSKLLLSSLLDTGYRNIYSVVIGKFFPHSDLAYYNRANGLGILMSSTPTSVLQSVTFPALCKVQDSTEILGATYRKIISISAFVVFPLTLGVGAVSYPLINVLYTDVWIFAAGLLQIIVFSSMWYPIHAINLNLLKVRGRSDIFFRLEIIKKILGVIMLCITVPLGLKAMCYGAVANSIIALIINTHYTGKLLNLGLIVQLKDIYPSLILSIIMFIACKFLSTVLGNGILSLSITICAGIIIYAGGAHLLKFKELALLKNIRK